MTKQPTTSSADSSSTPTTPDSETLIESQPPLTGPGADLSSKSDWDQGDPVEVRTQDRGRNAPEKWTRGRYQAYFPQYGYHAVRLPDGSTWQGESKDIRVPGEGN